MAEAPPPSSSGTGMPIVILVVVALLAFAVPKVGEVVFQWVPAAMSVVTGVEVEGDLRYLAQEQEEMEIAVNLYPVSDKSGLMAQVANVFDTGRINNGPQYNSNSDFVNQVSRWWSIFVPISIFVSLLFLVGIIYSVIRLVRIREIEREERHVSDAVIVENDPTRAQLRWRKILEHANTNNPNDWRSAIIEADIMLDELLDVQGYHGDTIGDKMKQVERSDFNTIDLAWDAHKVRNRIAHEGFEHELNARVVRHVISMYEQVLREFHYI